MVKIYEGHSAEDNENNIKKLIEIEYYSGRLREDNTTVFKIFIVFLIPLIVLGYLQSKTIINGKVYFRISLLVIVFMGIVSSKKIYDIYWRNKMNYDNYDRLYNTAQGEGIFEYNRKNFIKNTGKQLGTNLLQSKEYTRGFAAGRKGGAYSGDDVSVTQVAGARGATGVIDATSTTGAIGA